MDGSDFYCLVCASLVSPDSLIEINQLQHYEQILFDCLQLKLEAVDPEFIPKNICVECSKRISSVHEFKTLILSAKNQLQAIYYQLLQFKYVNESIKSDPENEDVFAADCPDADSDALSNEIKDEEKPRRLRPRVTTNKTKRKKKKIRDVKVQNENFICDECGKCFNSIRMLQSHNRSHLADDIKKQFACNDCGKKFTTKQSLNWHSRIHQGIKEYTCDQCGKSFAQKGNLEAHLYSHVNITPFSCKLCPKTFKNELRLKRHLILHSEEKPFKCEVCGNKYRQKWHLNRHVKVHSKELPFECEYCHKCFRLNAFLRIHLRQHTGERPYSCLDCNHHFSNSSNYIKHMRKRHGKSNSRTQNSEQLLKNEILQLKTEIIQT